MYATRNGGISARQITSCIHSVPNHAYYPVFCGSPNTSTIRNIDEHVFIPGTRTTQLSNFQSTLAKARPNDTLGLREERRQVRIVIDVRIYPSMDQPPIASGKADRSHRE